MQVLKAATAIWSYAHHAPRALPDDGRLTFALSLAVLQLVPRQARPSRKPGGKPFYAKHTASARVAIGARLRSHLAIFFANVMDGIGKESAQQHCEREALSARFDVATTDPSQQTT